MHLDSRSQTKLSIIQLECPEFSAFNLQILEKELADSRASKKRAFWNIPEKGEQVFGQIKTFSPHQLHFWLLFKLAERDGRISADTLLEQDQSALDADDYDYWCKADYWRTEEFIGLMLGRQPGHIATCIQESPSPTFKLATDALSLKLLLSRSHEKRFLDYSPTPRAYLAWAKGKKIDPPEQLAIAAEKYGLFHDEDESVSASFQGTDAKNVVPISDNGNYSSAMPEMKTKERDSMSKLIIGLAVGGYSYDPTQKRSPVASEISDDLARLGISMDVDTIRKYLKQSADYMPSDDKPNSANAKPNSRTA